MTLSQSRYTEINSDLVRPGDDDLGSFVRGPRPGRFHIAPNPDTVVTTLMELPLEPL